MKTVKKILFVIMIVTGFSCEKEDLVFAAPEQQGKTAELQSFLPGCKEPDINLRLREKHSVAPRLTRNGIVSFRGELWAVTKESYSYGETEWSRSEVWSSDDGIDWRRRKVNPFPVRSHAELVVYHNKIWLIGGINPGTPRYSKDVWNTSDGVSWNRVTSTTPFTGTGRNGVVVFNDKIFVLTEYGGAERAQVFSSSNGADWTLETATAFPANRYNGATVAFKGHIYHIGGTDAHLTHDNQIWKSADGRNWEKLTKFGKPAACWDNLFNGRGGHTATVYDGKVWIIGGIKTDRFVYDDIWFSEDMTNWKKYKGKKQFPNIREHNSVVFDQQLLILGGREEYRGVTDFQERPFKQVWSIGDGSPYPSLR